MQKRTFELWVGRYSDETKLSIKVRADKILPIGGRDVKLIGLKPTAMLAVSRLFKDKVPKVMFGGVAANCVEFIEEEDVQQ